MVLFELDYTWLKIFSFLKRIAVIKSIFFKFDFDILVDSKSHSATLNKMIEKYKEQKRTKNYEIVL